jgi:hypothetical protein
LRGYVHEEEVKTNAQAIEEWDNQWG